MSKHEQFEATAAATGLVSMQFIGRICDARIAALAKFKTASEALSQAFQDVAAAEDIATAAHGGHAAVRYSTRDCEHIDRLHGKGFDPEASFNAVRQTLDAAIWTRLMEQTGSQSMMDDDERRRFADNLRGDDVPEATLENVSATFQQLCADAETIFLRGLVRSFTKLDRRFKSHDGFKVGSRVIIDRLMSSDSGSWSYGSAMEGTFLDLERIFALLEGVQPAAGATRRAIEADRSGWGPKQSETMTRYFKVRVFKNGNAHLWMMRDDLVQKVNRKLADYYGEVLADAAPKDCTPDIFKTRSSVPSKNLAFYPTPAAVAETAVEMARISEGMRVLEPSAGIGNLVWPILAKGAVVDAVEIHPDRAAALQGRASDRLNVRCANFLSLTPREDYDRIVLNPPFEGVHYFDHVLHAWAFLKPGGRLVAILPASAEVNETPKHLRFRAWAEKADTNRWGRMFHDLPPESFKEVGVNINTVLLSMTK
ncbi:DUF4942 domain-containing protein [Cereibacter sp. SYSU M97828]|nr:DUF4942 domain-containing protein [Cereibacter flavus]